ncbi:MAG: toxin TumE [Nodosilinea sp.]
MRHSLLATYLAQVEQRILDCRAAYVEVYREEILTDKRANLRIRIRFNQGHLLEINEAIVISDGVLTFLDYRYHCQDGQNRLLFRYDSTPHFPGLPSFPHHKHLPDRVIACDQPSIGQIIQEAIEARAS